MTPTAPSWAELLAEPPAASAGPHWLSAVYGRLRWAHERCGRAPKDVLAELDVAGRDLDGVIRLGRAWGDDLSPPTWSDDVGLDETLGTSAPRLVVVGDARSHEAPMPFYSRSGRWLWEALRLHGYDELGVVLTNAKEVHRGRARQRVDELLALHATVEPHGAAWLVLGEEAAKVCRRIKLQAVYAAHPQQAARFKASAGPEGYRQQLAAAGLVAGPWYGRQLPTHAVPAMRAAIADRYAIKEGVAFRPAKASRATLKGKGDVAADKLAEARRLYVTSQVGTLKAAAQAVEADYDRLAATARLERWAEERDQVQRDLRERCKAEMIEGEAKRISTARDLAWAGCTLALTKLVRSLQEGAEATSADAQRLGNLAVMLSGHAPTSAEQQEIADLLAKGPAALAKDLAEWAERLTRSDNEEGAE